jgi:tetratricopeptide (TPR) repeat protein
VANPFAGIFRRVTGNHCVLDTRVALVENAITFLGFTCNCGGAMPMKQVEAVVPENLRELGEYNKLVTLLPKNWQSLPEFDYASISWRLLAAELAGRADRLGEMRFALTPYLGNIGKAPFAIAARVLLGCSEYHFQSKALHQALKSASLAQTAAQASEDDFAQAEAVHLEGKALLALEKWDDAIDRFEQAIALYSEQARPYRLGLAYLDLGATLNRIGNAEEAHTTLERSIKLLSKSRDEVSLALARLTVAESLNIIGEPETAYQYLLFALETFSKIQSKYMLQTLNDIAATLMLLKDFAEAENYINRAIEWQSTCAANQMAVTYEIRARLHIAKYQFDAAEKDLQKALELADLAHDYSHIAEMKRTFGRLRLAQKRYEEATLFFNQALDTAQEYKQTLLELELKALLAQAICEDNPVEAFKLVADVETALEGRCLVELKRVMQSARKRLNALEQEHYFVLSDAKLPPLADARDAMLKWMWARSLYKARGSSRKAATILGVTPTYIRRLTKIIPRDLLKSKKKTP